MKDHLGFTARVFKKIFKKMEVPSSQLSREFGAAKLLGPSLSTGDQHAEGSSAELSGAQLSETFSVPRSPSVRAAMKVMGITSADLEKKEVEEYDGNKALKE